VKLTKEFRLISLKVKRVCFIVFVNLKLLKNFFTEEDEG